MADESEIKNKAADGAAPGEPETQDGHEEAVTFNEEEFNQIRDRIKKLEAERDDMKQLAQRLQADFDNFRKRNACVRSDSLDEGVRRAVKELLPVMDNFDRALGNADNVDTGWLEGIKLVHKMFMESLARLGLEEIPAEGKFDPELHDAVMQEEAEGTESGHITGVILKGYRVKDRIIRHSMVKVAK